MERYLFARPADSDHFVEGIRTKMKTFPVVVGVVVLAVGAGAIVVQQTNLAALREEVRGLNANVERLSQELRAVKQDTQKLAAAQVVVAPEAAGPKANQTSEIAELREQVATLKKPTSGIAQLIQTAQARATDAAVPTKLVPVSEWKNAGRATPGATAETVLWAAAGGDVATIANAISLTDSARQKAEAIFARLPEQTRSEYGTVDNLAALMIAKDAATVTGMQVLGQRELSNDQVVMRLRFGNDEGKTKDQALPLQRTADGWKVIITDDPIDKWARQLSGK
jgi:outer membrane murein-binding lipoprotein Lpp